jgi:hypothetical protein
MARFVTVAFLGLLACWAQLEPRPARAADSNPDLTPFAKKVGELVRKHYPDAMQSSSRDGSTIHFQHNTRVFMIHQPDKFGEWQDAREERGPKKGGILCDIESRPGKYNGAAVVPQEFDERYFTLYLAAPYSKKLDRHVYIQLKYPKDVSEDFLEEFKQLVNNFDKSLRDQAMWW